MYVCPYVHISCGYILEFSLNFHEDALVKNLGETGHIWGSRPFPEHMGGMDGSKAHHL